MNWVNTVNAADERSVEKKSVPDEHLDLESEYTVPREGKIPHQLCNFVTKDALSTI